MKISQYTLLSLTISFILFLIPFFWFKPGEMDLGGDSSRLYFYDPLSYFYNSVLYVVSPSNHGFENWNYANLPFIFLLLLIKTLVVSPTILIAMFYGLSLGIGFFFCYLIIKELIDGEVKEYWYAAAIVGGLMYIFSPALVVGWKHVLIIYNQIFLNPLFFYLLLKYFKTTNIRYLFIALLLTFIFSPNFSIGAAPAFFAFYPLSILFLLLYTKFVLKRRIILKHIYWSIILFAGIQAFHLLPMISSIFSSESDINATIFSDKGKLDRGLSYFSAIVPSIKASRNLFALPQASQVSFFSNIFIISPFIIVVAFLFNKKRTLLLTAFFFFVVLFFATGNITDTWLSIYKSFFNIPGFSMFRNLHGQWQFTYIFFYSILFGQALYILLSKLKRIYGFSLIIFLTVILIVNAIPLIKGDTVNDTLWQSNNVKAVLKIDPDYEKALSYVRTLPADAKVLTLPLTDPGYQIIGGRDGGAYMGPSTISYLAGKKDFAGYDELLGYKESVLRLIRDEEYEELKKLLGFLNIKYIFYDADPLVYDKFPSYPYEQVRTVFPKDQKSYKELIRKLQIKEMKNFNNKFFVYEIPDTYYMPQISIVDKSIHINQTLKEIQIPLLLEESTPNIAVFLAKSMQKDPTGIFNETLVDVTNKSAISNLFTVTNGPTYDFPFASWEPLSPIYPFIVAREKKELNGLNDLSISEIDRRIFLAEKRLAELLRWGEKAWVLGDVKSIDALSRSWQEPTVLEAILFGKYNYWEIGFLRYQRALYDLVDQIETYSHSDAPFIVYKERIRNAVSLDRVRLYQAIVYDKKLNANQKKYLFKLTMNMFDSISNRLEFSLPSFNTIRYDLSELKNGEYSVYVNTNTLQEYNQSEIRLNGQQLSLVQMQEEPSWVKASNISIRENTKNNLELIIPESFDIISNTLWESVEKGDFGTDSASLIINDNTFYKSGIVRNATNWRSNAFYILSFEYNTYGKSFHISFAEKPTITKKPLEKIISDELYSSEWKHYKAVIASGDDMTSAFLQITKTNENEILDQIEAKKRATKIDIRNLSLIEIPNPKIIFQKIKDDEKNRPNITFSRINPSRYEVHVQNVTSPYTIVLMNQFNTKWKLIDPTQDTDTLRSFLARVMGKIGKAGISLLGKQEANPRKEVLRYFDGNVNQTVNQDVFLDTQTFDTWGKTEIAEYKHFPVNGYANAWYVEPKDMQGKTDYTLIIEMTSQKMLYGGLFLSIGTFFVVVLLLAKTFFKK